MAESGAARAALVVGQIKGCVVTREPFVECVTSFGGADEEDPEPAHAWRP